MSTSIVACQSAFTSPNYAPVRSQLLRVSSNSSHSLDLLRVAHDTIYEPSLKMKDDLESFDDWKERLHPENPSQIVALVGGQNLNSDEPDIQSVSIAYYYPTHHAGQLAYLAVSPHARSFGWGKKMVHARLDALAAFEKDDKRGPVKALVIETNDPKFLPAESYSDSGKSVSEIFAKMGALEFGVNYLRPEIKTPERLTDHYQLMAYSNPRTGKYPDHHGMECALRGIYEEIGITEADDHPAFSQMMGDMRSWKGFFPPVMN